MPDPMAILAPFHCWRLDRVSSTTFPPDIVVSMRRAGQNATDKELHAIADLVRTGSCYRCRIGKRRFFYGKTALEAAQAAAGHARRRA